MKGREIISNAVSAKMPDRAQVKENCLQQAVPEKQKAKRPVLRRSVFTAATAAALVMCIMFGNMLMNPKTDNIFTIKAYAMEQQSDGYIELREVDLLNQIYRWSAYNDNNNFFLNVTLKCEGENIKSVDFFADDGFFAKQYLKTENGKIVVEDGVTAMYLSNGDGGYTLAMYGTDFDIIGDNFTLKKDDMTNDFLLFLGTEISDWQQRPSKMTIHAVATFNDGKTQEESLTFDLTDGEGIGLVNPPTEELERRIAESEKYQELLHSIPLEKCEAVPDSVQILSYGDTFEFSWGDSVTSYHPITKESMDSAVNQGLFDGNGIFRQSSNLPDDGSDGYITVIENNGDGTFNGMVYKVPGQLILDNMK